MVPHGCNVLAGRVPGQLAGGCRLVGSDDLPAADSLRQGASDLQGMLPHKLCQPLINGALPIVDTSLVFITLSTRDGDMLYCSVYLNVAICMTGPHLVRADGGLL